jgi:hypothetical protein
MVQIWCRLGRLPNDGRLYDVQAIATPCDTRHSASMLRRRSQKSKAAADVSPASSDPQSIAPHSAALLDVMPSSPGWNDVTGLLAELQSAFGKQHASIGSERSYHRLLATYPQDRDEHERIYLRELEEAEPLIRELASRAAALRKWPLLRPAAYEREWRGIIEKWNQAIRDNGWRDMAPFCEICGLPMFRKAPVFLPGAPGKPEHIFACSERCRNTRRVRVHRQRVKLQDV